MSVTFTIGRQESWGFRFLSSEAEVNFSNTNAFLVLDRLGLDTDDEYGLCGQCEPKDFLGRVLVMNIGRDDSGYPNSVSQLPGCATVIDCGLRPGYFDDAKRRLVDLAEAAMVQGALVTWA
jgi:hypothetical protein